ARADKIVSLRLNRETRSECRSYHQQHFEDVITRFHMLDFGRKVQNVIYSIVLPALVSTRATSLLRITAISNSAGIDGCAHILVTHIADAAVANFTASTRSTPLLICATSAPQKVSPAAVVSTAST